MIRNDARFLWNGATFMRNAASFRWKRESFLRDSATSLREGETLLWKHASLVRERASFLGEHDRLLRQRSPLARNGGTFLRTGAGSRTTASSSSHPGETLRPSATLGYYAAHPARGGGTGTREPPRAAGPSWS
jgi:hypothetical protein